MEFTTQQKTFINTFVTEIINGDAAIFAGAGLSATLGFVDSKNLLRLFDHRKIRHLRKQTPWQT